MVPWWFSSIVLMCFARCAVTRHPSPAARSTPPRSPFLVGIVHNPVICEGRQFSVICHVEAA